jgi:hypothetical protein
VPATEVGNKDERPATPPPAPNQAVEAARLSRQLLQADPTEWDDLLAKLRDSKGAVHTRALAGAIPQLDEPKRKKARAALTDRLTRMTPATLATLLGDENPEVRSAAALACAARDERPLVPKLIALLDDPDKLVSRSAYLALKSVTGQDLGPAAAASPEDRRKAIAAWKAWWDKQSAAGK